MAHVEYANDVVHLHNIALKKNPRYTTTLGSRESLIMKLNLTPPQLLFQILWS